MKGIGRRKTQMTKAIPKSAVEEFLVDLEQMEGREKQSLKNIEANICGIYKYADPHNFNCLMNIARSNKERT
jgi:hypothetical protein